MKGCLLPLVRHVNLKSLATAEAADSFDGVYLLRVFPILNLDKCIVERHSVLVVAKIDVDTSVNQELLSLECGISSCTGHVNSVMEQVASLVVNLIDVCTEVQQFLNGVVLSSDQGVLQSEEPALVHLIDIGSEIQHLVGQLEVLLLVEVQEGSSALTSRVVDSHILLQECLEHVHVVGVKVVDNALTHQVEWCHLIVIRLIGIDAKRQEVVEHGRLRLSNDEMDGVPEAICPVLTKHLLAIDPVVGILVILRVGIVVLERVVTSIHHGSSSILTAASSVSCLPLFHFIKLLLSPHYLLVLGFNLNGNHSLLSLSKLLKLQPLLLFQVPVLLQLLNACVDIGTLADQNLQDVDERLDDDLVEEVSSHCHFLFLGEVGVIVVVVALVGELIEDISIGQVVHSSVCSMNE